jgi:hypothetical protein
MSAKTFLVAHGEKLALGVVAGGCGLVLWSAIDDPTIRPKDNQTQIEAINTKIAAVFKKQSPPVMKEPRPYLDQLLGRAGESAPVTPTMAWLTNPPDKGRGPATPKIEENGKPPIGGQNFAYLYVYELLTPTVSIKDAIGSLKISVAAPPSESKGARRISSESERKWTRDEKGIITNSGRLLGVQVEIKIGDNEWKPLVLPGASKDGVLPLTAIPAGEVTIPTPEPWQTHKLRARLIAAATALDIDKPIPERPKQTVLVHSGPASGGPTEDQAVLDKALVQINSKDGALFKTLLRPSPGPLPAGTRLQADEKLFLGAWSLDGPDATVDATASVRFALIGLSTAQLPEDPQKTRDVGRFLLLRLFEQGGERKWMEKPIEEKFGVGDVLGVKQVELVSPFDGKRIKQDLPTPFVVDKLVKDQERVLYWFIKPVAREEGGRGKKLFLDKKTVKTDIVELKNPDTGSVLVLTKLISVNPPTGKDVLFYPHRAGSLVERDEFTKAPSEFRQYKLVPEAPKAFKPGTGPLDELHKAKKAEGALDLASYETDTDYYVFPDGRIAWWELIERTVKVHDPDGVMEPKEAAPAPAPTVPAPEAAPETGPATPKGKAGKPAPTPPGMPGGAMPPGAAPPPGMMPGQPAPPR